MAGGAASGDTGRAHRHHGAADRRIGHGQGSRRAVHPPRLDSPRRTVHRGELRGAARSTARVRALRLRARRVHRRRADQARTDRARLRRHALPRRDRGDEPAAQAKLLRVLETHEVAAPRRLTPHARRHPRRRRHQSRPEGGGRARRFPGGLVLSTARLRHRAAAAARTPRRCAAAQRDVPGRPRAQPGPSAGGHLTRGARRAGRARVARQRPRAAQRARARGDSLRGRADHQGSC